MGWGSPWRNRRDSKYPGNGPWRDLPPWERPGWRGRGRGRICWRYVLESRE